MAIFFLGYGVGPLANVTFIAALTAINDQSSVAAVTTLIQSFREIGATIAISIPAAVFENVLRSHLWADFGDRPGAREQIDGILDNVLTGSLPDGWWEEGVRGAFVDSFKWVWWTASVAAVACVSCMAVLQTFRLRDDFDRDEDRETVQS